MKKIVVAVFMSLPLLGGCVAQSQESAFSWYHPMGGEYLFSYDKDECESAVQAQGQSLGTDIEGPFFACMQSRGYALVTTAGVVRLPPADGGQQTTAL